jgi:ferredoxin-thioredoxin reductase catalytic subunit
MRTTKAVREKLEQSARKSGRSLTQEVEVILEIFFALKERRVRSDRKYLNDAARQKAYRDRRKSQR